LFVTAALVVASVILWLALKNVVREQIDQRLDTQIGALAITVQLSANGKLLLSTPMDAPPFDRSGSGWYWQIDADGQQLTSRSLMQNGIDAPAPRQSLKHMLTGMASPGEARDATGQTLYTRQITRSIDGTMMTITATAPSGALVDPAVRALLWLIPCMLLLGIVLLGGKSGLACVLSLPWWRISTRSTGVNWHACRHSPLQSFLHYRPRQTPFSLQTKNVSLRPACNLPIWRMV
jgi:hypothetical protein